MPDDKTGSATGDTTAEGKEETRETEQTEPQAAPTSPPAGEPTYTQADIDAAAASARRKAEADAKAAKEKLAALEAAAEERRKAELTEAERAREEKEAAEAARREAEAELAAERARALRATVIMAEAPALPAAYKAQVTGDAEEAIKESLAAVQQTYEQDVLAQREAFIAELVTMTADQVLEAFPENDAAKALVERFKGAPVNIGGPSNASGQAPTPPLQYDAKTNNTPEAWAAERERLGFPPIA